MGKADNLVESLLKENQAPVEETVDTKFDAYVQRYGEEAIKNFIYNRHCARFDPTTSSVEDAVEKAWQYHTPLDEIVSDLETVESYSDLDQYFRR